MLLPWIALTAFVLSLANNNPYAATQWKNIDHSEIFQFALNSLGEKLSNAALGVIPDPNTADSPLNKFVEGSKILVIFKRSLYIYI